MLRGFAMRDISDFSDKRLKDWCIHCGGSLASTGRTRDHVPTRKLLIPPLPPNLPVVPVCYACNQSFSKDEQYLIAFLSVVLTGSTDPSAQQNPNAARILTDNPALRAMIEASRTQNAKSEGVSRLIWSVDLPRVRNVVVKNARGHAMFEIGEPMIQEPGHVAIVPFVAMTPSQREQFENVPVSSAWPEVGSRMMQRVLGGQDMEGPWVIVQADVYRYSVVQTGGVLVRTVMSEYLATEVRWE